VCVCVCVAGGGGGGDSATHSLVFDAPIVETNRFVKHDAHASRSLGRVGPAERKPSNLRVLAHTNALAQVRGGKARHWVHRHDGLIVLGLGD
jgi:hypothetical protein